MRSGSFVLCSVMAARVHPTLARATRWRCTACCATDPATHSASKSPSWRSYARDCASALPPSKIQIWRA
jgi:transposase-like protein